MMGRSGRFLAGLAGLDLARFLAAFECVNLLRRDGRRLGKGREFGPRELREASAKAAKLDLRGRDVLLAGKRVARAFSLRDPSWLKLINLDRGERSCVVFPHPSGIVQWWNDAGNRRRVARLLRRALGKRKSPAKRILAGS